MKTAFRRKAKATLKRRPKPKKVQSVPPAALVAAPPVVIQSGRVRKLSSEDIALLQNTVAKGTSDNEFKLFLWVCTKHKLDPLTRQIHCIMRFLRKHHQDEKGIWVGGHQMTIQMGIDGYRALAARDHKDYGGCDEPEFEFGTDRVPGTQKLIPVKATIRLWRKGFEHPTVGVAYWDEYAPDLESENAFFWKKMPKGQLAKCAEALALRKAYPELSDIYTTEEMAQSDEHTPEGRQIITSDGASLAGGSREAAQNVAKQKLAEHAAGKSLLPAKEIEVQPEQANVTAKVEEQKQKEIASVKNKVVEYYPGTLGDVAVLFFVRSEALAAMLDNGFAKVTMFSQSVGARYFVDDPGNVEVLEGTAKNLGFTCQRVAAPEGPNPNSPSTTAQSPAKPQSASFSAPTSSQPRPNASMAPPKAVIPPFQTPMGAKGQREAVSDRTASQPQTPGTGPQTLPQGDGPGRLSGKLQNIEAGVTVPKDKVTKKPTGKPGNEFLGLVIDGHKATLFDNKEMPMPDGSRKFLFTLVLTAKDKFVNFEAVKKGIYINIGRTLQVGEYEWDWSVDGVPISVRRVDSFPAKRKDQTLF